MNGIKPEGFSGACIYSLSDKREAWYHVYGEHPPAGYRLRHFCGDGRCVNRKHAVWTAPSSDRQLRILRLCTKARKHGWSWIRIALMRRRLDLRYGLDT